ncbi:MAG: restriction endonuclease subunit S [Nostoc sp.]|uniref:restriction endonuclease subunit S n=1 Tax=Nostoc sp. TaxID=1180 RepID=UPI002FF8A400
MREVLVKNEEFKDSPLGKIPKDWDVNPLSTLGEIVTGTTPPSYVLGVWGDTLPFITPGEISEDGQILNVERSLSPIGINYVRTVPSQAVLVVCIGSTLGKTALSKEECATNQQINAVIPNSIHDSRFIYAALTYQIDQLLRCAGLQAVPIVNKQQFGKMLIPIAPPNIQRIIAEILDTVDEAIARTSSLIIKLKQTKAGLLQDLLTRGLDNDGKLRDPQAHPEQFKDSPLGIIPKNWEVFSVGDCILKIEQGWSPDCESFTTPLGEWGVLKTTSVVWEGYQDSENKRLPSHLEPDPNYEVKPRDVLMTRAGPNSRVGVVALVSQTQGKLMLSDKLYRLVPRELIKPDFLVYTLSGSQTQSHLSTLKTGLAESQTNISQEIVRSLLFILPSRKEQANIISILDSHDTRIRAEEAYLNKLKLQKQGLMQDLLTGKVRVRTIK